MHSVSPLLRAHVSVPQTSVLCFPNSQCRFRRRTPWVQKVPTPFALFSKSGTVHATCATLYHLIDKATFCASAENVLLLRINTRVTV